jgi:Glycosyl hydrolases family 15
VAWLRAAVALLAAAVLAAMLVSGGSTADPRTPAALPGLPPPFLGTAVAGDGGLAAAIDAYGSVVDLRPGPAGPALIDNPAERQDAGTVAVGTGIVPRVGIGAEAALPFWRADSVRQRYLPGTNVVRTVARFGRARVSITDAAAGGALARVARVEVPPDVRAVPELAVDITAGASCEQARGRHAAMLICATSRRALRAAGDGKSVTARSASIIHSTGGRDRRWIGVAKPLGTGAPGWARAMYERSLLTLRALTDRHTGAVAAGARDGWAYVWPRDAGAVALAFAAAGYRAEARRIAHFLLGLDLGAAARFHGDGAPVRGREAQGDAAGWTAVAARAAGLPPPPQAPPWRNRPDYQEGDPGTYLANAIAAAAQPPADGPISRPMGDLSAHRPGFFGRFAASGGLVRGAGDPHSGLDSAAAWAVRPFPRPELLPAVRETLLRLAKERTGFGIVPSEDWPGVDPWTAPTAWTAWSLAALSGRDRHEEEIARHDRRAALGLLAALRRAATPAGALPERVDARTGVPRSTTPLAWSHAFVILALRQLWGPEPRSGRRQRGRDGLLRRLGRDHARGALHAAAPVQLPAAQGDHGAADRAGEADLRERPPLAADRDHGFAGGDDGEVAGVADASGDDVSAVLVRLLD